MNTINLRHSTEPKVRIGVSNYYFIVEIPVKIDKPILWNDVTQKIGE